MSSRSIGLSDGLHDYLVGHGVREPEALATLRAKTATLTMARMQISPEQGGFMRWLASTLGVRRAIEVGTFTGYSAASVALALPEDGKLVACDVSEEWTSVGRPTWEALGVADRIDLRLAPAAETLEAMLAAGEADQYDWAFVDADKTSYATYVELLLRLVRVGGVILIDNVLWGGSVIDDADQDADTVAIRALNAALIDDDRVAITMTPIGDGLTLLRRLK